MRPLRVDRDGAANRAGFERESRGVLLAFVVALAAMATAWWSATSQPNISGRNSLRMNTMPPLRVEMGACREPGNAA